MANNLHSHISIIFMTAHEIASTLQLKKPSSEMIKGQAEHHRSGVLPQLTGLILCTVLVATELDGDQIRFNAIVNDLMGEV